MTTRHPQQVSWSLVVGLAVAACSSSSGGGVSASQAASDLGTAFCAKFNSCSPVFIKSTWGDTATCATRIGLSLTTSLGANGTGWTPSAIEACVQALPGASCDDILDHNVPGPCHTPAGKLADGMACADSAQCMSAYCNKGTDGVCGACASSLAADGSPCYRDDDCNYGSVCAKAMQGTTVQGTCVPPGQVPLSCDTTHPCLQSLVCKGGMCATPDAVGQACMSGTCNAVAGEYCNQTTCAKIGLAAKGQPCGLVGGLVTVCTAGGNCPRSAGVVTGTCVAAASDGASCNDLQGASCLNPAVCTGGVCKLPSACM